VKEWNGLGNFNIPKAKNAIPGDIKKTMELIYDYIRRINKHPFERKRNSEEISKKDSLKNEPETIDFDVDDRGRLINVKTFL
jgi:hypothetical protein